jgi:hypothetical protein
MIDTGKIIQTIDFENRYISLCQKYNDALNSLKKTQKKEIIVALSQSDIPLEYISKDKFFKQDEYLREFILRLGVKLNDGIIEPFIFIIEGDSWIIYNRVDFLLFENNSSYNRAKYNILYYNSYPQMVEIIQALISIYSDFKKEFLKQLNEEDEMQL